MQNSKDTASTPKELLNDLQALVVEAETMMTDSLSENATEAVSNLRARFDAVQERFSDIYEGTKKKVVEGAKYTDETIRESPYQSLAVAAGIGLLVGVLLGRRSK